MPIFRNCSLAVVLTALPVSAFAGSVHDFSGDWRGSFDIPQPDGTVQHDTAFLKLKTDDARVSGSAGRADDMQTPISQGSTHGDTIEFSVEVRAGTVVRFKLARHGDHLIGTATGVPTQAAPPVKVDVTRAPAPTLTELLPKFMGAVRVARGEQVVLDRAFGNANLEWKVPNTTHTKFRIGSLTKQFTAASILLLAQRHQLGLDDAISRYIDNPPASWAAVTLRHLLTHTSGIVSLTDLPVDEVELTRGGSPLEIVARFRDKPLLFPPGTQSRYSNSGYILLATVIEKVAGMSYGAFLQTNIFDPLGMHDTGIDNDRAILPQRASGYRSENGTLQRAEFIDMRVPYGAGDLYSTVGDLQLWENGLFGERILQSRWLKEMITPNKDGYGAGVVVTNEGGHRLVSHTGGIQGFVADLRFYPDDNLVVIVLSNSESKDTLKVSQLISSQALAGKLDVALTSESLRDSIIAADELLFAAYNACNVEAFGNFLAPDLQFFHDITGLTNRDWNIQALRQRCGETTTYRRELDEQSVQVFPVPGYGALELGTHRFYEHTGDSPEKLDAAPMFANVWKTTSAGWQLAQVLSYGH